MERILITGANRGLGLEFVRQYSDAGSRIFATCRNPETATALQALQASHPDRLSVLPLDVTDEASIRACLAAIGEQTDALDVLINNAGIFIRGERPDTLDAGAMLNVFHVNAIGPLMVARQALDLLRKGNRPRIINITSRLGSITLKQSGGNYSYCASKAALNMLTRTLSFDVRADGIIAVMLHPGWVQTDMGGQEAPLKPEESIRGMRAVIESLRPEDSGRFLQWDGEELPW
ncbi:MAG TPA: SDR family oxidoreductase [Chloroflexi bacterium]|nr:SDR family oxidoreductase [Chloroflexota bacterium]